ncbi:hypothetical protein SPACI_051320 [Sporomusa acidovorans DSM 3132]|uniref:FHA domain-containing protein n=2 Tax=Sporomusa TaxID=2375 RepID=A0ABZ3JA62_SPOA4|nr:FHA domain-containing protein [Sporomusa acidovorans]OZC15163.1 FHA domain protein [Sporomusa acidovorans DSM 3132]SDF43528.1 Transcriptional regulatory protein, C terminal [Sporomusa acidovorans]
MLVQGKPTLGRLVVERGAPYEKGMCFSLSQPEMIIGRATMSFNPNISFSSLLISRKHCRIANLDGIWSISELGSKHGTLLNEKLLEPHYWYTLQHGDRIVLAASIVSIRFAVSPELEKTLDFDDTQSPQTMKQARPACPVVIDTLQKALYINNIEIPLSVKEWYLLDLLYQNRNQLVSYADIQTVVWPERIFLDNGIPSVGSDEINLLLYRLRRKLGTYRHLIKTRRGQGCIFEF